MPIPNPPKEFYPEAWDGRSKPEAPKKLPEELGRGRAWTPVISSWIEKLRFIEQGVSRANVKTGYVDMKTKKSGVIYRYGPGIPVNIYVEWRTAISKGSHWWRRIIKRWSPARKIGG